MDHSEVILQRLVPDKKRTLHKGDRLFGQGDQVENLYLLRQGMVKLIRHSIDGNDIVLQTATPNDIIAEASLFADAYHCSAIVQSQSAELSCFDRKNLLTALKDNPDTLMEIVELFAHRMRKLRALLEIKSIRSAKQRMYSYFQLEADANNELKLQLSYKEMAYQLGLAHETFYRNLKCLEDEGKLIRKTSSIQLI
ncbi:Crp/Fnr family transcriptional regulator [Mariprofundus ferrooxydans]|uniref:Crp family transcriptional regulatory protein n=1 Tax=Mariprofundus ferrooxydans PV-1 TaxID=314345 RepID=Q0F294_9PROT|nr:Crp/Fnr family transcriptional regulator [Mariprofundus ferrooxydans]EAU55656.1 Crp family transcriptional regulatory protein [Mariprofundus ferrooxydans PV-1]KON48613.1 Crp/Fnr family transcriptional regulator [Mariprofundus ferrooxydans]